ncbi:hypothetical protein [Paenibacillus sp. KR2-11]|nr:hypothetical protein [Paenibacillus caseinilyticus]
MQGERGIRRAGRTSQILTLVFGGWMTAGLFLREAALDRLPAANDHMLTPWNGVWYSGYAVSVLWLAWLAVSGRLLTGYWRSGVPEGYGSGMAGAVLGGIGMLGGVLWRAILGEPAGAEAIYSPSGLLQLVGAALMVSSPLRAVWRTAGRIPARGVLWPGLLSMALASSVAAYLARGYWMYNNDAPSAGAVERLEAGIAPLAAGLRTELLGTAYEHAMAGILLTVAILILPLIWTVNRWKLPFGSFLLLAGVPVLFMSLLQKSLYAGSAGILTGVAADLLYGFLGASHRNNWKKHVLFTAVPLCFTGFYFLLLHLRGGLGWSPSGWGGAMLLSALTGLVLSHLVAMNKEEAAEPR